MEGTGEPAYTNSTQNTQWIRWQAPAEADAYRLHARYYRDNVQVSEVTWSPGMSGTAWLNWSGVATLEHGRQYGICVTGEYSLPNDSLYFPDGPNSCSNGTNVGKRSYTTIDRSKPSTSVAVAGGADFTKQQTIPVSIGFQDDVAGPHPANFVCVKAGADPCQGGFAYLPECSVPGGGGKSTTFGCGVDASQLPDGPVTVCAIAADAAVPDNPSSADQTRSANQANLSDAKCDTVVLDRQGPTLAVNASKTVVRTGEQVAFSADASDSGSGIDTSTSSWAFGDGTPATADDRREPLLRSARHLRGQLPREGQGGQRVCRPEVHHGGGAAERRHHPTERRHDTRIRRPLAAPTLPGVQIGAVRVERAEGRPARQGQAAPYSAHRPSRRAR